MYPAELAAALLSSYTLALKTVKITSLETFSCPDRKSREKPMLRNDTVFLDKA